MDEGTSLEQAQAAEQAEKSEAETGRLKKIVAEVRKASPNAIAEKWDIARRINDLMYDPKTYEVAGKLMEVGLFVGAVATMFGQGPDIPSGFIMNSAGIINGSLGKMDISPNVPMPMKPMIDVVENFVPNAGLVSKALELAPDLRPKAKEIVKNVRSRIREEEIDFHFHPKISQAMKVFGVETKMGAQPAVAFAHG